MESLRAQLTAKLRQHYQELCHSREGASICYFVTYTTVLYKKTGQSFDKDCFSSIHCIFKALTLTKIKGGDNWYFYLTKNGCEK